MIKEKILMFISYMWQVPFVRISIFSLVIFYAFVGFLAFFVSPGVRARAAVLEQRAGAGFNVNKKQ